VIDGPRTPGTNRARDLLVAQQAFTARLLTPVTAV
jgi:hypothetical protein